MATFSLLIPQTDLVSPISWGSRASIVNMVDKIIYNYSKILKIASDNSKIPIPVLVSFIAVESGGNATAGGSGSETQGLMQWNRKYAQNFLEAEFKMNRLTPEEKKILSQYNINFDKFGKTRIITQSDLVKPELNILIGSILLGQYLDSYFDGGKKSNVWAVDDNNSIRIDRIIAVYNSGAYGDTGKKARLNNYATPSLLAKNVNPITRSYIAKILGINGAMDVATKELAEKIQKIS